MSWKTIAVLILVVVLLGVVVAGVVYLKHQKMVKDSKQQFIMGKALMEKNQYREAAELFRMLKDQYGKFIDEDELDYLLADSYLQFASPEAVPLWEKISKKDKNSKYYWPSMLNLAKFYDSNEKTYEKALNYYNTIMSASSASKYHPESAVGSAIVKYRMGSDVEARDELYSVIEKWPDALCIGEAMDLLSDINTKLIFSPRMDGFGQLYTIKRGDTPIGIANQFDTTAMYLMMANGIGENIKIGKRIKVPTISYRIVVSKKDKHLYLYSKEDGKFIKRYLVGIGKYDYQTPLGTFTISNKQKNAVWYSPNGIVYPDDPEYPLGTRWLGFGEGSSIGIHGTNEPETIGKNSSQGCVRMHNEDVEELYVLATIGTSVEIRE